MPKGWAEVFSLSLNGAARFLHLPKQRGEREEGRGERQIWSEEEREEERTLIQVHPPSHSGGG